MLKTFEHIRVNWNDGDSIRKLAARKLKLENAGYKLINTISGPDNALLVYKK